MATDRSLQHELAEAGEQVAWDWSRLKAQEDYLTTLAKYTMFSGGFGTGKCERWDTWVETAQGRKRLVDIAPGDLVWSIDAENKLGLHIVRAKVDSGTLPETTVRLDNGLTVSASPWHPFLRLDPPASKSNTGKPTKKANGQRQDRRHRVVASWQWTRADALEKGDRIAVASGYPDQAPCGIHPDYLFLLGVLVGDGCLSQGATILAIGQEALAEELRCILYQSGAVLRTRKAKYCYSITRDKGKKNWVTEWLRELGLLGKTSHTKFVPPFLFGAAHSDIAAFLSGLFVTDGWVDNRAIGYCSVSEQLLDEVQALLLRLGVRASKTRRVVKYKEGRVAYTLTVSDPQSIQRCGTLLDLRWKQPKLTALVQRSLAKKARGKAARFYAGDVEFVRVTHITHSSTPVQMYDLEIEGVHNFIGNGVVAHNTTVLCAKVILLLLIPNNLGYLGRLDGKALRASTMQSLYDMLPKDCLAKQNDQKGFLQLKPELGGGKLIYGDFKDLNDLKNIPLGFFAIDQAEEITQPVWDYLVGRLRRANPVLHEGLRQYWVQGACQGGARHYALHADTHCRVCRESLPPFDETRRTVAEPPDWELVCYKNYGFGVCNPEGPSHWIYKSFPNLPGQHGLSGPGEAGYQGFHATCWDGLKAGFTSAEYVHDMEQRYKKQPLMWDRYLEGKWVEAEGLVYPTWNREASVLPRHATRHDGRQLIAEDAQCFEYIDHGLTAETAVGWLAIEQCDCGCERLNYFLLDEHYEGGKVVSYHAAQIKAKRETLPYCISATYLDSQAFSKTLMGQQGTPREDSLYSVADEYTDHHIYPVPNQKDWDAGYNRINELFINDPRHVHPITGQLGAPHFYVFQHNAHFLAEVESYKWKRVRNTIGQTPGREEPQDGHDHHMDGLNGCLTSRPVEYVQPSTTEVEPAWVQQMELELSASDSHMGL